MLATSDVAHAAYTVLGWRVTDISAIVTGLGSLGVVFVRYDGIEQYAQGLWTVAGRRARTSL